MLLTTTAHITLNLSSVLLDVEKMPCFGVTGFKMSFKNLNNTLWVSAVVFHPVSDSLDWLPVIFSVSELILSYIQTNDAVDDRHMSHVWLVSDYVPISSDALSTLPLLSHFTTWCYVICENFQMLSESATALNWKPCSKDRQFPNFIKYLLGWNERWSAIEL